MKTMNTMNTMNTMTTTTTPDWGVAYCRGECLGWVGLRGQPGDDFLDGHYESQAEAEAAMNAVLLEELEG